jgi:hypothetical protein
MAAVEPKKGYRSLQLWVVLLTPLLVIIVSSILYYSGWLHPATTTNKGELIMPPVSSSDVILEAHDRSWWLMTANEGRCEEDCVDTLFWLQQIHIRLGKEGTRVSRMLLTDQAMDPLEDFPGLEVMRGDLDLLPRAHNPQIFIMDPNGNIMMKFPKDLPFTDIHDDLNKLLSRSTIG